MITGGSTLDPGFPTWGTMLREHGYHTRWFGKWHLTHGDSHWTARAASTRSSATASPGGTFPSPERRARPGLARGPATSPSQFASWFERERAEPSRGARRSRSSTRTTSPGGTSGATAFPPRRRAAQRRQRAAAQLRDAGAAARAQQAAPAALAAGHGRQLVRPGALRGPRSACRCGCTSSTSTPSSSARSTCTSARCCRRCTAARRSPRTRSIVFTSDHGEYGGSHGLRGKGAGAYEEAIRVPLLVKDHARPADDRARDDRARS